MLKAHLRFAWVCGFLASKSQCLVGLWRSLSDLIHHNAFRQMADILGVQLYNNRYLILPADKLTALRADIIKYWLYEYNQTLHLDKFRLRQLNVPFHMHPFVPGKHPTVIFHPFEQMSFEVTETVANEVFEPQERVDFAITELFAMSSDKDPALSYAVSFYDALESVQDRSNVPATDGRAYNHLWTFSQIYKLIMANLVGNSVMDVGTCLGLLPIFIKERFPRRMVTGCDISNCSIETAARLALTRNVSVDFHLADVTDHEFIKQVGVFDTVTAVHLLEHFTEETCAIVMKNLYAITRRRLIVCVPFERGPTPWIVGHRQVFDRSELTALGARYGDSWQLQSTPDGGILIVDRHEESLQ